MKILLLSDSHGFLDERVKEYAQACDEIWHAGDIGTVALADTLSGMKPLQAVYGNVDGEAIRRQYSEDLWFDREGLSIWMTHIGGYPPRYNRRVKKTLNERVPDVFVCGHSHILKVVRDEARDGMLCLNPGAVGKQGFHQVRTMLRFTIQNQQLSNMEVIELGKK